MHKQADIKCVIWDLDETIWDGTLLETGDVTLKPGIREIIRILDERGILHSIASKNYDQDGLKKLDEFGLTDYFVYSKINWNAKSVSVGTIHKKLNIHPESILFIDDNPVERDEVHSEYPEVLCVDAKDYTSLLDLPCMNPQVITEDAYHRRRMVQAAIQREDDQTTFQGPKPAFLKTLKLQLTISKATESDLARVEELTLRTHQLNTTGITYRHDELSVLLNSPEHTLWICGLTDRYGPYGKIGLALVEKGSSNNTLQLLLMSCRVMSLGIGTVLLSHIMQETKSEGKRLHVDFRETDRNRMMKVTLAFGNFKTVELYPDGRSVWDNELSIIQAFPPFMDVRIKKKRGRERGTD